MEAFFVSRFLKGVVATSLGTIVTLVIGFVNIGIAARFIPKDEFGVFILIQTIVFSVIMAGDLGVNVSTTKFLAGSGAAEKSKIMGTALLLRGVLLLAAALIVLAFKSPICHLFKSESISNLYYYVPVLVLMEGFNALFSAILQGLQQYRRLALAQIIASATNVALILVTVIILHYTVQGLILSRLAALLIAACYQMWAAGIGRGLRGDLQTAREIFKFGIFLGVNNVLSFVFSRIDTIIIGAVISPVGVALYGTAAKLPDASRQLFESFRSVFFPNMAELFGQHKKEEAEAILNNSLRLVSFVSLLVALTIIAFRDEVVRIFFSYRYLASAPVLSLLLIALCIGLIGNIMGTSLVAAGYSKLPALINIVDASVCVAANLALIPTFGILGAGYAAIIARAATTPVNVYFLKRYGIEVNVLHFLKPLLAFGGCLWLLQADYGYFYRVGVLLAYLLLCGCLLTVTREDFFSVKRAFYKMSQPVGSK
jgi:O-antigen/teichoic acid export membrane protein